MTSVSLFLLVLIIVAVKCISRLRKKAPISSDSTVGIGRNGRIRLDSSYWLGANNTLPNTVAPPSYEETVNADHTDEMQHQHSHSSGTDHNEMQHQHSHSSRTDLVAVVTDDQESTDSQLQQEQQEQQDSDLHASTHSATDSSLDLLQAQDS